jgi:hypothetical protein
VDKLRRSHVFDPKGIGRHLADRDAEVEYQRDAVTYVIVYDMQDKTGCVKAAGNDYLTHAREWNRRRAPSEGSQLFAFGVYKLVLCSCSRRSSRRGHPHLAGKKWGKSNWVG